MQLRAAIDSFGRLTCAVSDGSTNATVTASNLPAAAVDLISAIENANRTGCGECFWHEGAGDYRWVFRRDGGRMRVAVMWSQGTLTGWEHVFWSECDAEPLMGVLLAEFERAGVAVHADPR